MSLQGQYAEIEAELLKLPQGKEWLRPDVKITYTPLANDSSDEDGDDDGSGSDDGDMDIDEDEQNEGASCSRLTRSQTRKKAEQFIEPEDGWTTVRNIRKK